jgi:hypothetical protein
MAILWQKAECAEWMFLQCRLCTHCVGCQQRSLLQHSCSNIAFPADSLETMCRMCSQARLAKQALCRLSLAVLTTAAQAQRRPRVEWAFMLCRLNASTAAAVTSSPFYSNSCSEIAGLPCELKIETMCRASVHAMQAVQTLSHLGSPLHRRVCNYRMAFIAPHSPRMEDGFKFQIIILLPLEIVTLRRQVFSIRDEAVQGMSHSNL